MVRSRIGVALLATALLILVVCSFVTLPQLVGNGLAVTSATIPPSWRTHRPPDSPIGDRSFGTALLLQSDDLQHLGIRIAGATQRQDGSQRLTACTGDQTMADLIKGDATGASFASALWRGASMAKGAETLLRESILRVPTHGSADRYASSLIDELTNCSYRRHGRDCHLGRPTNVPTEVGQAVRLVAYGPDGSAVGGVGVFFDRDIVGVFELHTADFDDPGPTLDALSLAAVRRIG